LAPGTEDPTHSGCHLREATSTFPTLAKTNALWPRKNVKVEALLAGRILEQYEDTGRGESCLVVGFSDAGKPVHVVCGRMGDWMVIITVYIPSPPKFVTPFQRSKS